MIDEEIIVDTFTKADSTVDKIDMILLSLQAQYEDDGVQYPIVNGKQREQILGVLIKLCESL